MEIDMPESKLNEQSGLIHDGTFLEGAQNRPEVKQIFDFETALNSGSGHLDHASHLLPDAV
jgi:hypothetical protein